MNGRSRYRLIGNMMHCFVFGNFLTKVRLCDLRKLCQKLWENIFLRPRTLSFSVEYGTFSIRMLVKSCEFARCWNFISAKRELLLYKSAPRRVERH